MKTDPLVQHYERVFTERERATQSAPRFRRYPSRLQPHKADTSAVPELDAIIRKRAPRRLNNNCPLYCSDDYRRKLEQLRQRLSHIVGVEIKRCHALYYAIDRALQQGDKL